MLALRLRRRLGEAPAIVLFAQGTHVAGDASVAVAIAPAGEAVRGWLIFHPVRLRSASADVVLA